jgi:nitrite reductase/ring-hydroxylating ferredoxin subunit/DMSO/TMAO reductase YedYZ heme-binding membrane subunit
MSLSYQAVSWNRQKKLYDAAIAAGAGLYLATFIGAGTLFHPGATAETLLIRGLGTLGLLMLHIILCIGPLCRLDARFLPLLYNRRHFGVAMFSVALAHGVFSIVQFHSGGDANPLVSLLSANQRIDSLAHFPFQQLGFLALLILFLMAATSHDFWLHTLSPRLWKTLHMGAYLAYGLVVAHVCLGVLQSERSSLLPAIVGLGLATVATFHLLAARKERAADRVRLQATAEGFLEAGDVNSIPEKCARVVTLGEERVAIFRYDGKISAISNVCRHQNGPLGEGTIVDGCITCPWHGYQYLPDTGASPPPFPEKVETYRTRVVDGRVWIHPHAHSPGTRIEPAVIP